MLLSSGTSSGKGKKSVEVMSHDWKHRDYNISGGKSISGNLDDFYDAHARWIMGACPCCGMSICDWEFYEVITEPKAVAEGVFFCGRCIANEHDDGDGDFLPKMLQAIADGERKRRKKNAAI